MNYYELLERARRAIQSLQPESYKQKLAADEPRSNYSARRLISGFFGQNNAESTEELIGYDPRFESGYSKRPELNDYFDNGLSHERERNSYSAESERASSVRKRYENKPVGSSFKPDPYEAEFDNMQTHRYFNSESKLNGQSESQSSFTKGLQMFWNIWAIIRIPIILVASVLIVYTLVSKVGNKIYHKYIMPVDVNDATPIVVTIEPGSGASEIAKVLYEACGKDEQGLIANKAVFKVYVDFIGKSSRLQAGTYILSKNMSIPDMVDTICRGVPAREVKKFQITEGMTIEAMAAKLAEEGIITNTSRFLELCKTGEAFVNDHEFINDIPDDPTGERVYKLEGFLFPATYEVYVDANEETIIDKMLSRFGQIWGPIYTARAKVVGLSMYEAITFASAVEKEARMKSDFERVAAVFSNRIARNMKLESDATIEYVLKTGSLRLTQEQLSTPSGYNTHVNRGLPIGPVCNPGDTAIKAALYPNEEYLANVYLYFCLKDPKTGELVFAKTPEEHRANVAKYSPLWQ